MQISHVFCKGATLESFLTFWLSTGFSLLSFHEKKVEVSCVIILFYYLGDKQSVNLKQIACLAIMFIIIFRTYVVSPPEKCVTNLHDDSKSNMAVIVKTSEIVGDIASPLPLPKSLYGRIFSA